MSAKTEHVFDGVDVSKARYSKVLPCPGTPLPPQFDTLPVLTRETISARIATGQLLVLHPPLVYKIPIPWLNAHPGGDTAILHFIGRDATNEIEGYHTGVTVAERMSKWVIGKVELDDTEGWRDMVPPIQLGKWPLPVPSIMVSRPTEANEKPLSSSEVLEAAVALRTHVDTLRVSEIDPEVEDYGALPLTPSYQHHLRQSLRKLHARIHSLDLDSPPPFLSGYGPSLVIYLSLALMFGFLCHRATSTPGYCVASVALGLFWHQVTFVAHDAGHTGLTGDWYGDRVRGIFIANFLGGMSLGWWCDNHNVHHLVTNSPEHDPDIQHLPFFAISTKFFGSLRSSYYKRAMAFDAFAQTVLPHQYVPNRPLKGKGKKPLILSPCVPYRHKLYYIIMCFARANLFVLSYTFMLTKWPSRTSPLFKLRLLEIVGIAFFWTWFGALLCHLPSNSARILFVLVSFAVTSPLHVQIVLSHFSQPISVSSDLIPHTELLESHAHRQLRTTMDIDCSTRFDFLHGGLNFQTPHHLFPRIPRFRFRSVAKEVEKWVQDEQDKVGEEGWKLKRGEGLVYKKMGFVEGNKDVLGTLKGVAEQVKLLAKVAEKEARGELHHY
ncbi:BQ5605_C005g03479 [Microbotryum silenes-dioicae]|uniref:Delta 8-(E)-sphingolipid desaturase n=1 Tax=Microbotryum silenes-dioicae TaxID=796604 RepID=A0A2X0MEY5_9BASI|nr:BQ5605_C005g03479 [Microbotryum silenes-dioicae]